MARADEMAIVHAHNAAVHEREDVYGDQELGCTRKRDRAVRCDEEMVTAPHDTRSESNVPGNAFQYRGDLRCNGGESAGRLGSRGTPVAPSELTQPLSRDDPHVPRRALAPAFNRNWESQAHVKARVRGRDTIAVMVRSACSSIPSWPGGETPVAALHHA